MAIAHPDIAAIDAVLAKGEWWLRLFDELSERGARRADVLSVKDPRGLRRVVDEFERIARGVRLAIVAAMGLERFLEGLARLRKLSSAAVAKAEVDTAAREAARVRREARIAEVRERVVDVIERETPDRRERDPIVEALDRRLATDPALIEFDEVSLRETVMRICADLGITPDWSRWEAGDWTTSDPPAGEAPATPVRAPPAKPCPAPWTSPPPPNAPTPPVFQGHPGLTARRTDTAISLALRTGPHAAPWRPPRPG